MIADICNMWALPEEAANCTFVQQWCLNPLRSCTALHRTILMTVEHLTFRNVPCFEPKSSYKRFGGCLHVSMRTKQACRPDAHQYLRAGTSGRRAFVASGDMRHGYAT